MLGTIVNVVAVLCGTGLGMLLRRGLPQRMTDTVFQGMGLCVMYIGISGVMEGKNALIAVLSMGCGGIVGSAVDLDARLNRLGDWLQKKLTHGETPMPLAQGFVSASLLFCVGAMAVVGSLQSGLFGDHQTLFSKSLIDGIVAVVLASSLGVGVGLSALSVLVYQGSITLLAQALSPLLSDSVIVAEMTCTGSLLIVAIALNMLKATEIKVMNLLPAIVFPVLFCQFL